MADKENPLSVESMSAVWNYPTQIRFGVGRIDELSWVCEQLQIKHPLLVTDEGLAKTPLLEDVLSAAARRGLKLQTFSSIQANPTGENIDLGLAAYQGGHHDGVIAFGGGSALDAGKAIALMVGQQRPIWDFEDKDDNWLRVDQGAMAPVVAVPTTSGTGSEVGRSSVIVDTGLKVKRIIFHPGMLPDVVIADPALTVGLPPAITAATGLDALVHNFEAYCADAYHPMAEGIALQGMRLIRDWLPSAYSDGNNLIARAQMMAASTMGASAFQKGLGGVHALAHPLGALYDKHHGLLNAIIIPYVLKRNRVAIEEKIARIALFLELPDPGFDGFMQWLLDLRQLLAIPHDLRAIGIDEDRQQEIGQRAAGDPCASGNPIPLNAEDYQQLFVSAVQGQL